MSPADFGLNSVGTVFGISGPAIPPRPDPICGIAHRKIFFPLRERIDEDVSSGRRRAVVGAEDKTGEHERRGAGYPGRPRRERQ